MSGTCEECGEVKWEVCLCSEPTESFPENAAQAQEINALKEHVNELRDLLNYKKWRDKSEPEWIMKKKAVLAKIPAQSLAAHNVGDDK